MSTGQRAENESSGSNAQRNLKRAVDFRQSQKTHPHKRPRLSRLSDSVESNETVQQAPSSQEPDEQTERGQCESYSAENQEEIKSENGFNLEKSLRAFHDSNSLTQDDCLKKIRLDEKIIKPRNKRDRKSLKLLYNVHPPAKQLRTSQKDEQSSASNIHQLPNLKEYANFDSSSLTRVIERLKYERIRRIGCDKIRKVSELRLYQNPDPIKRIITCMKFNKSGNFFATVGTSKRIKLYKFNLVLKSNNQEIYPIHLSDPKTETSSYISSLSWSPFANQIMVTSDYRGNVLVWDVDEATPIYRWKEHTTRVWSVDFNHFNQRLFASGSDDFIVKLYDINQACSTTGISLSKNVCSVEFSPFEKYQLLIGSSDKTAIIYDIRNASEPLEIFEGHDRTVSYAQFLSRHEIVTASIDSTARIWDVNSGTCKRVLRGHQNEKYFTGLANKVDYILCGSEDNTVYLYHKDHPSPKYSYKIREDNNFISSICWKEDSNYALVANKQGILHVLEIN